jgi:hypothetical protein
MQSSCHTKRWCSQSKMVSMVQLDNLFNPFSLLRGKKRNRAFFTTVLVCVDYVNSLVMWTQKNLNLTIRSTTALSVWMGACSSWHWEKGCCPGTILPGHWPPLYRLSHCHLGIRLNTVVLSANLMMAMESCAATQSWVNREYRRRLSMHSWGTPVLKFSMADV